MRPMLRNPRSDAGFVALSRFVSSEEVDVGMPKEYKGRTVLGLMMMSAQAFGYNAVFFTYGLVLTTFMHVGSANIGYYIVPFAVGNFLGPLLLGPLFDRVGRRVMLTSTWIAAGTLLTATAILFQQGQLSSYTLTTAWSVVFFFASAGASAAYLTVSEVFPLKIRAMAIAFFYAVGTGLGGIIGPALLGKLIGSQSTTETMVGFLIAAGWLVAAGVTALFLAVDAEQKSLEDVAEPLSAEGEDEAADEPVSREREHFGWSPRYSYVNRDYDVSGQVAALVRTAGEAARPLPERELLARTNARHWGPSVARRALRRAVAEGRLERTP
jgi:MFS family permease